jgi:uncharacterized protein (DUF342 family)
MYNNANNLPDLFNLADAPKAPNNNIKPTKNNNLYLLYCYTHNIAPKLFENAVFDLAIFCEDNKPLEREQNGWLVSLAWRMNAMPQYSAENLEKAFYNETPQDAVIYIYMAANNNSAWLFMLPPLSGGNAVCMADVNAALEEKKVVYGVDYSKIAKACENGEYLTLIQIAKGTAPIHGKDGFVKDYYKRELEIEYAVREDGSIDYRELGWLQTIRENEIICQALPPTPAVNGLSIKGDVILARNGKNAILPIGKGTKLSGDKTCLYAQQDGVLYFSGGKFIVEPLLIVHSDVDNTVGNLDVIGDLIVHGDVHEGYTITASGNITIRGKILAAHVSCGGILRTGLGINGQNKCVVSAGDNIYSPFIENAQVNSKKSIFCDYIVGSEVSANESIYAKYGKASIIGGIICAQKQIETITIGTAVGRNMTIILGTSIEYKEEENRLCANITAYKNEIENKEKNLAYFIENNQKETQYIELYVGDMKSSIVVLKRRLNENEKLLAKLRETQKDLSDCFISAKLVNPPLSINIGPAEFNVSKVYNNAKIFAQNDEVIIKHKD